MNIWALRQKKTTTLVGEILFRMFVGCFYLFIYALFCEGEWVKQTVCPVSQTIYWQQDGNSRSSIFNQDHRVLQALCWQIYITRRVSWALQNLLIQQSLICESVITPPVASRQKDEKAASCVIMVWWPSGQKLALLRTRLQMYPNYSDPQKLYLWPTYFLNFFSSSMFYL